MAPEPREAGGDSEVVGGDVSGLPEVGNCSTAPTLPASLPSTARVPADVPPAGVGPPQAPSLGLTLENVSAIVQAAVQGALADYREQLPHGGGINLGPQSRGIPRTGENADPATQPVRRPPTPRARSQRLATESQALDEAVEAGRTEGGGQGGRGENAAEGASPRSLRPSPTGPPPAPLDWVSPAYSEQYVDRNDVKLCANDIHSSAQLVDAFIHPESHCFSSVARIIALSADPASPVLRKLKVSAENSAQTTRKEAMRGPNRYPDTLNVKQDARLASAIPRQVLKPLETRSREPTATALVNALTLLMRADERIMGQTLAAVSVALVPGPHEDRELPDDAPTLRSLVKHMAGTIRDLLIAMTEASIVLSSELRKHNEDGYQSFVMSLYKELASNADLSSQFALMPPSVDDVFDLFHSAPRDYLLGTGVSTGNVDASIRHLVEYTQTVHRDAHHFRLLREAATPPAAPSRQRRYRRRPGVPYKLETTTSSPVGQPEPRFEEAQTTVTAPTKSSTRQRTSASGGGKRGEGGRRSRSRPPSDARRD